MPSLVPLAFLFTFQASGPGPALSAADSGFRQTIDRARARQEGVLEAEALIGLARIHRRRWPSDSALSALARADAIAGQRADTRLGATVSCLRAEILAESGRLGVEAAARHGLKLAQRDRHPLVAAQCWRALGAHYINTVDDPKVSRLPFDSAEVIDRREGHPLALAETLLGRAADRLSYVDLPAAQADLDSASRYATGSTEILAGIAQLRARIGWLMGDFAGALSQTRRADSLLRGQGDRVAELKNLELRARLSFRADRLDDAESASRAALDIATTLGRVNNIYMARNGLAHIRGARGEWSEARRELEAVVGYMEEHGLSGWIPGLAYGRGLAALRQNDLRVAEAFLRTAIGNASEGEYLVRYQARVRLSEALIGQGRAEAALSEVTEALTEMESLRASLSDRELRTLVFQANAAGEEPDLGMATVIAGLVRHGKSAEAFGLSERRRARELADRLLAAEFARVGAAAPASHPETRASAGAVSLDDSTAILVYVTGRGGQATTGFVRTAGGMTAVEVVPIDSVRNDVARLRTLTLSGGDGRPVARILAARVLMPVLRQLGPRIRHLLIVPDDGLHLMPWDVLPLPGGDPVATRFTVTIVPSVAIAGRLALRTSPPIGSRVLAFGDARFVEQPDLPRLRASAGEARRIGRFGRGSIVRLRAEASEAYLKRAPLDSFRVVHLATHALVSEGSPEHTALVLAPGDGEDGFLGPAELRELRIGADLVVLSACRTAGGTVVGGEGIQGLTAPLLEAGAGAVLATLWPVRDESVAEYMNDLYRALAAGAPLRDAVQAMKRAGIERGRPATEWAAFVLVGDGAARILLEPPAPRWPMGLGAALAGLTAIAGLYLVTRNRRSAEAA